MNYNKKFNAFLESFMGHGHDNLIETLKHGFKLCFENSGDAQTVLKDARVINNFGDLTVEEYTNENTGKKSIAVSDGWLVDYVTFYDSGKWKWMNEGTIDFPPQLKEYLNQIWVKYK